MLQDFWLVTVWAWLRTRLHRSGLAMALCMGLTACPQAVDDDYLRFAQMSFDATTFGQMGVGDVFELRVYREENMTSRFTVTAGGEIQFPLIGTVRVLGRSCADLEGEVRERLAAGYLRDPAVTCQLIELRSLAVVVSGEVRTPGRFAYTDSLTVVEALALAQGRTENAAMDRVIVTRIIDGQTTEISVPMRAILAGRAPNFRLWPNDIVTVPSFRLLP